jgi:hypothetical protein
MGIGDLRRKPSFVGKISNFLLSAITGCLLLSCSANPESVSKTATTDSIRLGLLESNKIKSDIEKIIHGENIRNPDTTNFNTDGADILSATAAMLADTGISKIAGNNRNPLSQP